MISRRCGTSRDANADRAAPGARVLPCTTDCLSFFASSQLALLSAHEKLARVQDGRLSVERTIRSFEAQRVKLEQECVWRAPGGRFDKRAARGKGRRRGTETGDRRECMSRALGYFSLDTAHRTLKP